MMSPVAAEVPPPRRGKKQKRGKKSRPILPPQTQTPYSVPKPQQKPAEDEDLNADYDDEEAQEDNIDDDFGFGGETGFETELDFGQHEPKPAQHPQKPPKPQQ